MGVPSGRSTGGDYGGIPYVYGESRVDGTPASPDSPRTSRLGRSKLNPSTARAQPYTVLRTRGVLTY